MLQKSKVADLRIFRENTKREAIARLAGSTSWDVAQDGQTISIGESIVVYPLCEPRFQSLTNWKPYRPSQRRRPQSPAITTDRRVTACRVAALTPGTPPCECQHALGWESTTVSQISAARRREPAPIVLLGWRKKTDDRRRHRSRLI